MDSNQSYNSQNPSYSGCNHASQPVMGYGVIMVFFLLTSVVGLIVLFLIYQKHDNEEVRGCSCMGGCPEYRPV